MNALLGNEVLELVFRHPWWPAKRLTIAATAGTFPAVGRGRTWRIIGGVGRGTFATGQHDGEIGRVRVRYDVGPEVDDIYEGDFVGVPLLAAALQGLRLEIDGRASGSDDFAGGIKQGDGGKLAGFDEFVKGGLEAFAGGDAPAAALGPHDQAESVGNVFGAID